MKKIGLLSDTHGYLPPAVYTHFEDCDEIWHAGDIGTLELIDELKEFKPVRAVFGNIDGFDIRRDYHLHQRFFCEGVDVWITHIGGYPDRYDQSIRKEIQNNPPKLFICGHSHILKVMNDKKLNLLHINPGAAGKHGFHKVQTLVKFVIDKETIRDLQVIELGPK
ncbi:metallophosphoesterase family protein [bacterium]|nr:metallophosphoesterase family protein [bacterium]